MANTHNTILELVPQETNKDENSEEHNLISQSTFFSKNPTNQSTSNIQNQQDTTLNELITNIVQLSNFCNLSPKNIVSIFSNQLNQLKEKTTDNDSNKEPIPRLKMASYGEVLTNSEVLE